MQSLKKVHAWAQMQVPLFVNKAFSVYHNTNERMSGTVNKHPICIIEPRHEISNNVVCATSKASDQPAHMRSLIRAFASRLNILCVLSY